MRYEGTEDNAMNQVPLMRTVMAAWIEDGVIQLIKIDTTNKSADRLTKCLSMTFH